MRKAYFMVMEKRAQKDGQFVACSMGQILSNIDSIGEWHFVWSFLFAPSSIACAAQRARDFEAPDLERGIHFRGVSWNGV